MHGLVQDLRHAVRQIALHYGYAAAIVLTLALAIGGISAVFTLADPLIFKPLPYPNADRIVRLSASSDSGRTNMFYADYLRLAAGAQSFDAVATFSGPTHIGLLQEDDPPESQVLVYAVPPPFLGLLGVQPAMGRAFQAGEHTAAGGTVALITHGLWQRAFGGAADVLGKQIRLHGPRGATFDVIGVLPRDFIFPDFNNSAPGILIPGLDNPAYATRPNVVASPFALLKAGVSREQAAAEVQRVFQDVGREVPALSVRRNPVVTPLKDALFARVRKPLFTLLALTGLVMLLAFANVSHLVRARMHARAGEIATRQALGGSRWRTGRLLFVETAVLAVLGLAAAFLAGRFLLDAIIAALPAGAHVYRAGGTSSSARVFVATAGFAAAGLVLFGGVPAWLASRADLRAALHGQSQRVTSAWNAGALIFAQSATAVGVFVVAVLTWSSYHQLADADLGFRPQGLSAAYVTLPREAMGDGVRATRASNEVRRRLQEITKQPVALASDIPGISLPMGLGRVDFERGQRLLTIAYPVSSEFYDVFRLRLTRGRWFTEQEALSHQPLVVVDERAAGLLWPGRDPLGQVAKDTEGTERRVVGVVAALKTRLADDRFDQAAAFVPLTRTPRAPNAIWRGSVTEALRADLRMFFQEIEPGGRVSVAELNFIDRQLGQPRFLATLLGALAVLAGALTLVGLYGVVSHDAGRRTREVGIRIALGANPGAIARMVTSRAAVPAALGAALGLAISIWWTQTIRSLLVGIEPHDWRVYAASAIGLTVIVALASWLPVRRATRVDPLIALKAE